MADRCGLCEHGHGTRWVRAAHDAGLHWPAWRLNAVESFVDWYVTNHPREEDI